MGTAGAGAASRGAQPPFNGWRTTLRYARGRRPTNDGVGPRPRFQRLTGSGGIHLRKIRR